MVRHLLVAAAPALAAFAGALELARRATRTPSSSSSASRT